MWLNGDWRVDQTDAKGFAQALPYKNQGNKMNKYTKQELEEATTSLVTTLHKCEKMQESGRLQSCKRH